MFTSQEHIQSLFSQYDARPYMQHACQNLADLFINNILMILYRQRAKWSY